MNTENKLQKYAPAVLRIGLALVFLWFGFSQLGDTTSWERLIPSFVTGVSGLDASTLVTFNGAFEVVFGICLLFGFFIRVSSLLLAVHMVHITFTLFMAQGLGAIMIRDFGLAMASIALFMMGVHCFSVDTWLCGKYPQGNTQLD